MKALLSLISVGWSQKVTREEHYTKLQPNESTLESDMKEIVAVWTYMQNDSQKIKLF